MASMTGMRGLLEAGTDANIGDEFGRTAAKIAATRRLDRLRRDSFPSHIPAAAGTDDPLLDANDGCALKDQKDAAFKENDRFASKMQGDAPFEENNYADALALYTKGVI